MAMRIGDKAPRALFLSDPPVSGLIDIIITMGHFASYNKEYNTARAGDMIGHI